MNYEENKKQFEIYIAECRDKIAKMFFNDNDKKDVLNIKRAMTNKGLINSAASDEEAIIAHRNDLIDIKLNHTMRVVSDIVYTSQKLGLNVDFDNVLKVAALLHDIGRFDQATWSNSFADGQAYKGNEYYLNNGVTNHAQAGYHILFVNNMIKNFPIEYKFYNAIGNVVKHHGDATLSDDLSFKFDKIFVTRDMDKIINNSANLNENEKILISMLVQLVKDVDMIDILYQHLTGEFPLIYDNLNYPVNGKSLEEIAKIFDIDPKEIIDFNKLTSTDISGIAKVRVPLNNANLQVLEIANDIKTKFYNKEPLDLKQLMARDDWTFINGMWWRLGQFLGNINFTTTLMRVEDVELLDKIYEKYPERFRFLVKDAFDFAKAELVDKVLDDNKDNIYVSRSR